ncbi:MAG: hypothetical protein ACPH9N_00385, partial [Alteromonas sp.]
RTPTARPEEGRRRDADQRSQATKGDGSMKTILLYNKRLQITAQEEPEASSKDLPTHPHENNQPFSALFGYDHMAYTDCLNLA